MSTHASTHDSTATPDRTTTTDAPAPTPSSATDRAPDTDTSWVARCQSQFDAGSRERLGNLADDENQYVGGSH